MRNHFNSRKPYYNDDSDYTTNAPSYYDDLARKQKLFQYLAEKIGFYDEELEKRFKEWDDLIKKFPQNVEDLLIEWMEDGTLDKIINENIFKDLNDLINNNFKDLNNKKLEFNYQHKRYIKYSLPLKFKHWQEFSNKYNGARLYPQSFTIDEKASEIFIYYSPTDTTKTTNRVIAIYDIKTLKYKTSFICGNAGGEGIVIRYINNSRYVYVKTRNNVLGRFLLDELPSYLQVLTYDAEYIIDVEWQFSHDNDKWIVVNAGTDYGTEYGKTTFSLYDNNFNMIGGVFSDKSASGYFNSEYEQKNTKRQGIALSNSKIYLGLGGYTLRNINNPYGYYGVRVLNMKGDIETDGVTRSDLLANEIEKKGYKVETIENEGVYVSKNGIVHSLCVHTTLDVEESEAQGIIIFEEFSGNENAMNLSSSAGFYPTVNHNLINSSMYPRLAEGKYFNVLTGKQFTKISEIIKFMFETSITHIKLFSSVGSLYSDYLNGNVPNNYIISITNVNNAKAVIDYIGNASEKSFQTDYYLSNNVYVENKIYDNRWHDLTLSSGITSFYSGQPVRCIVSNDIKILEGTLNGITSTALPQTVATLPSAIRPNFSKTFNVALNSSSVGGYGIITIQADGKVIVNYVSRTTETVSLNNISYY